MATFKETKDFIREQMGDRKLDAPQTAPTIVKVDPGLPGWLPAGPTNRWLIAVAFMYEESTSDLGPSASFDVATIPEKPSLTAFHSDATLPEGVRGFLVAITKSGGNDFFEAGRVLSTEETTFTFTDTEPDDDLDQSILSFESKIKDSELTEKINRWNQQVNSRSFPIRKQLEVVTQATSTFALVFATGPNTITRPTGSWIDDGYFVGGQFNVTDPEDSANNGVKTITVLTATVMTVSETLVANASDTTATITLGIFFVNGQAAYTLPLDVAVMNEETLFFLAGIRLREISQPELVRRVSDVKGTDTPTKGRPALWYQDFDKTKVRFHPVPAEGDVDDKVSFEYVRKLATLVNDSDELLEGRHEEFHVVIAYGAIAELFRNRQNFNEAREFERLHDKELAKLREKLTSDKVQSPIFRPTICRPRPTRRGGTRFADPDLFFRV